MLTRLIRKYTWVYERECGDKGIVVARNRSEAIKKLRRVYDDVDNRLGKIDNWMFVFSMESVDIRGDVFITTPY